MLNNFSGRFFRKALNNFRGEDQKWIVYKKGVLLKVVYFLAVSNFCSVYNKILRLNNLKARIAVNAKLSVFVICVEPFRHISCYSRLPNKQTLLIFFQKIVQPSPSPALTRTPRLLSFLLCESNSQAIKKNTKKILRKCYRFVIVCSIQIAIRMLYHSFETLQLLSFFFYFFSSMYSGKSLNHLLKLDLVSK